MQGGLLGNRMSDYEYAKKVRKERELRAKAYVKIERQQWRAMIDSVARERRFCAPNEELTYARCLRGSFYDRTLTTDGAELICRFWEVFDQYTRSPRCAPTGLRALLAAEFGSDVGGRWEGPAEIEMNGITACLLAFVSYPGPRLSYLALLKVLVEHYGAGHRAWVHGHTLTRPFWGNFGYDYTRGAEEAGMDLWAEARADAQARRDPRAEKLPECFVEFHVEDTPHTLRPIDLLFGLFPSATRLCLYTKTTPRAPGSFSERKAEAEEFGRSAPVRPRRSRCFDISPAARFAIEAFPTESLYHVARFLVAFTRAKEGRVFGRGPVVPQEVLTAFFLRMREDPRAASPHFNLYSRCSSIPALNRLQVGRACAGQLRRAIISTASPETLVVLELDDQTVSRALCGTHRIRSTDLTLEARAALCGHVNMMPFVVTFARMGHAKRLRMVKKHRKESGETIIGFGYMLYQLCASPHHTRSFLGDALEVYERALALHLKKHPMPADCGKDSVELYPMYIVHGFLKKANAVAFPSQRTVDNWI